ncbi:transient receptor potential cation channel protein painless [Drosophila innubila]|uniref:transient receptor potential cation channel protein painless n=1 Tax=Drosophila innubila TaxID=198719 RepID=UPI00148B5DE2|nr:transient receptor potential cation channel protein painless [Drosophila innubila]
MDLNGCGFSDPQAQLSLALAKKDIREFHDALDKGAQPNLQDERHTSIYQKALSTAGCAEFIEACLDHGSHVNYINQKDNKAAINYAADSRDPRNLEVLLRRPGVQVDRKYGQLTPLNSLAKNLTADNVDEVRACMQSLLEYGASPNAVDQREMTPLHYVLKNNKIKAAKQELVLLFLAQPKLDIDSYRNGEVRQLLQQQFPEMQLPQQRDTTGEGEIDCERLMRQLRDGEESQFEQLLAEHQLNISDKDNLRNMTQEQYMPLLQESIKRGKQRAFEAILNTGININKKHPGEATLPIELSIIWGNWQALEKLLQHPELKISPGDSLLTRVISRLEEPPLDDFCDHQRCFELLLSSDHVDINEADPSGQVPLHFAVKYRNTKAAQTLLHHGAYIGAKSKFQELPIQDMPPELLEQHFDSCVTTNQQKPGVQTFEIIMNYMNLMRQEKPGQGLQSSKKLQDEMTPIAHIAESKELRHLLQHPLISSFLFLKWHRLSVIFYLNFLLYTLFTISIIGHTLLKFHESDHKALSALFGLCSWIGIVYLIIREIIQFVMSPVLYFFSVTNLMELALIIFSILTCLQSSFEEEPQRVLAVLTVLLVAVEFCLLVGSLPVLSISTHMLMLRAVSSSFIKSFALYSIFVLTFSLCFYILFGKSKMQEAAASSEDGHFNSFSVPIEALIKTIVMLTGEFDAGDIKFDSVPTYLIFLLFVFFMTIVLFNLLNGLAVSDTQAIKAQAELNGAICRTNTLMRYEQVLTGRNGRTGFIVNSQPFRTICQRLMNIYPNYMSVRQISILPNDGNKVLIPMMDVYELKELSNGNGKSKKINMASFQPLATNAKSEQQKKLLDPPLKLLPCCCSLFSDKCSQIDNRTVKLALAVIDQKSNAELKRQREQITERRLQQMEQKLEQVLLLLHQERN